MKTAYEIIKSSFPEHEQSGCSQYASIFDLSICSVIFIEPWVNFALQNWHFIWNYFLDFCLFITNPLMSIYNYYMVNQRKAALGANLRFFIVAKIGHYQSDNNYYQKNAGKSFKIVRNQPNTLNMSTTTFEQIICRKTQSIPWIFKSWRAMIICKRITSKEIPNREHNYNFGYINGRQNKNSNIICGIAAQHVVSNPYSDDVFPSPTYDYQNWDNKNHVRV
jgi:hypothetical protein